MPFRQANLKSKKYCAIDSSNNYINRCELYLPLVILLQECE